MRHLTAETRLYVTHVSRTLTTQST